MHCIGHRASSIGYWTCTPVLHTPVTSFTFHSRSGHIHDTPKGVHRISPIPCGGVEQEWAQTPHRFTFVRLPLHRRVCIESVQYPTLCTSGMKWCGGMHMLHTVSLLRCTPHTLWVKGRCKEGGVAEMKCCRAKHGTGVWQGEAYWGGEEWNGGSAYESRCMWNGRRHGVQRGEKFIALHWQQIIWSHRDFIYKRCTNLWFKCYWQQEFNRFATCEVIGNKV